MANFMSVAKENCLVTIAEIKRHAGKDGKSNKEEILNKKVV